MVNNTSGIAFNLSRNWLFSGLQFSSYTSLGWCNERSFYVSFHQCEVNCFITLRLDGFSYTAKTTTTNSGLSQEEFLLKRRSDSKLLKKQNFAEARFVLSRIILTPTSLSNQLIISFY